jgi:RNA polymerase primary sigma factor
MALRTEQLLPDRPEPDHENSSVNKKNGHLVVNPRRNFSPVRVDEVLLDFENPTIPTHPDMPDVPKAQTHPSLPTTRDIPRVNHSGDHETDSSQVDVSPQIPAIQENEPDSISRASEFEDSWQMIKNTLTDHRLLSAEEELQKTKEYQKARDVGDTKKENEKIEEILSFNYLLVLKEVIRHRNYRGNRLPEDDLFQEGVLALRHAIEKFDPERGFRLSTYATPWIKVGIQRYILEQNTAVDLPLGLQQEFLKLHQLRSRYVEEFGRLPKKTELMRYASDTTNQDLKIKMYALEPFYKEVWNIESVDQPLKIGEDFTLGDSVGDPTAAVAFEISEYANLGELRHLLKRAIKSQTITDQQAKIIALRHGLYDDVERGSEEVAALLGLTKGAVKSSYCSAKTNLSKHPVFVNRYENL